MLGGVDGGPWAVGGGLEVRLFFLGLFGESGEPPVPGLKSAAKVLLFVTPENMVNQHLFVCLEMCQSIKYMMCFKAYKSI